MLAAINSKTMREFFLSYAKEDKSEIDKIYLKLMESGLNPWMDSPPKPHSLKGIPFGEKWDTFLEKKLHSVDLVLIFLSRKSIEKKGYVQKEYKLALNKSMYDPASSTSLIPVLLEDAEIPDLKVDTVSLKDFQWYNLQQLGIELLIEMLLRRFADTNPSSSQQEIEKLKRTIFDLELKFNMMANRYEKQLNKLEDEKMKLEDDKNEYMRLYSEASHRDYDDKF